MLIQKKEKNNESKEECKDQESIQPHLTRDTIWESDRNKRKHDTQESQEVSPFQQVITRLQGTDKAAYRRQT